MTTDKIEINALSPKSFAWIQELYRFNDSFNLEGFLSNLAPECTLQFGNAPLAPNKQAIAKAIGDFFQSIAGMNHQMLNLLEHKDLIVMEAAIDYVRKSDQKTVTTPCVTTFRRKEDGLVREIKIFIDVAPLYT